MYVETTTRRYYHQTRHYHRSCWACSLFDVQCHHYTCNACLREQAQSDALAEMIVLGFAASLKGISKGTKCIVRKTKRQVAKRKLSKLAA